jgi:hypothetical protein
MYNSIFQQPWWLDAVAPGQWGEVIARRGPEIAARLPFVYYKKYGLTHIAMPHLTQTLGPWIQPSTAKYARQLEQQKDLMNELIEGLPRFDYFCQNFHFSVTNILPFYWKGFDQATFCTYVIDDLSDIGALWHNLMGNIRTDIKKAKNRFLLKVKSDLGIDAFLDINEMTYARQDSPLPYNRDLVLRIDKACETRECRKIFFAVDDDGSIHAAAYIIWDEHSAYYLMGGADPELRNSGASSFLIWEAIKFSATVTRKFDFEGSRIEPVERFFRGFGAVQKPYSHITAMSRRMRFLAAGRDMFKSLYKSR